MPWSTFFSKRLVGAAAMACAGALTVAPTLAAGAFSVAHRDGDSATGRASCAASALVAWLDTQPQGALGTYVYDLQFTNLSGGACTLAGYPRVSAIGIGGSQIGRAASDYLLSSKTVVLARGATATALLFVRETGTFKAPCGVVTAAGLRVYPPDRTTMPKLIPFPFSACSTSQMYLSVGPVRSG